jgi:hypothetical protein
MGNKFHKTGSFGPSMADVLPASGKDSMVPP